MSKVIWKEQNGQASSFDKLEVGDFFKIDTSYSKGAVYRKVALDSKLRSNLYHYKQSVPEFAMEEVETGKVFAATTSKVKLVDAEISINSKKPTMYK